MSTRQQRITATALVDAGAKGWTVVDMKADWKVIYPFQKK